MSEKQPDIRRNILSAHITQAQITPSALALEIGVHAATLSRFLGDPNAGIGAKAALRIDEWMRERDYYIPGRPTPKAINMLARYGGGHVG